MGEQQTALDGTGNDPGLGALANTFMADNDVTGQDRLNFL